MAHPVSQDRAGTADAAEPVPVSGIATIPCAFTAGPWAVHPFRASVYVVPSEHVSRPIGADEDAALDFENFAQEICLLHWPDRHRDELEVQANACLIAAAPSLYHTLSGLLANQRRRFDPDEEGEKFYRVAYADVFAVLARARGEA